MTQERKLLSVPSLTRFAVCTKCGCTKALSAEFFHRERRSPSGLRGECKVCHAARMRSYRQDNHQRINQKRRDDYWAGNREMITAHNRKYYEEHREQILAQKKIYHRENRNRILAYSATYYQENLEAKREAALEYQKSNPDKARARNRRYRARKNGVEHIPYTDADINDLWYEQKGQCAYCSAPIFSYYHLDHVVPLSRGGADGLENIVLACPSCNCSKKAKTGEEYMEWLQTMRQPLARG